MVSQHKPEFARRLAALRKERGFSSPEELAAQTNGAVSASSIQKYETGNRKPGAEALAALAKALDCRQEDINPYAPYELGYEALDAQTAKEDAMYESGLPYALGKACALSAVCPANQGLADTLREVLSKPLTPAQVHALETVARGILAE